MVKRDLYFWAFILAFILLAVGLLQAYVVRPIKIQSGNMTPLLAKHDRVLAVRKGDLENLDVVAYNYEGDRYTGRIIGLPGQEVAMLEDVLYIDGQAIEEAYTSERARAYTVKNPGEVYNDNFNVASISGSYLKTIPEASYLILNDNRENRADSRNFGLIGADDIYGRLAFRFSPVGRLGFISTEGDKEKSGLPGSDLHTAN